MDDYIIEMLGITKEFPGIIANDNITLQLRTGEIHALLGENGAGKSTLMSVLFGLYQPEKGIIKVRGRPYVCWLSLKGLPLHPQSREMRHFRQCVTDLVKQT